MPKAPPPTKTLKYSGKIEYPLEKGVDDWGLTPEQQESYVEQFRLILVSKNAWREDEHDFYKLRRYLRARTYDLEKATTMWMNHLTWRKDLKVDTVLQDFEYHEKRDVLKIYPQGYHKCDKQGRPVYIQEIGGINMAAMMKVTSEDRMIRFHIQEYERCVKLVMPVCSKLQKRNIDTTFGIMDVKGIGLSHLTGETKRLLGIITKIDQDNYPEMLGHICIINAPYIFRMVWNAVKGLVDARTQGKIEILGPDYSKRLLEWIDAESLPTNLGGKSEGQVFDDIGPWSDQAVLASLGINLEELRNAPPYPGGHQGGHHNAHHAAGGSGVEEAPSRGGSMTGGHGSVTGGHHPARAMSSNNSETGYYSPTGSVSDFNRTSSMQSGTLLADTIPEGLSKTLVERIQAIEKLLPQHSQRLRPHATNGAAAAAASHADAFGEGSLLQRVQILEEGMEWVLAAQTAVLQKEQGRAAAAPPPAKDEGCACCCVQ